MSESLRQIWESHSGNACLKLDVFVDAQDAHLSRFRGSAARMLEIGVLGGGSLQIWQKFLGPAATLVGVDIAPAAVKNAADFKVHIGDQADAEFLAEVAAESGPFDIVVDDGGHEMDQQISSFATLYPLVREGGCYIVEDAFTSYWDEFGGGLGRAGTFMEFAKQRIDELDADFYAEPTTFTRSTTSVHFYKGMVVFEKHANEPPRYMISVDGNLGTRPMNAGPGFADEAPDVDEM